MKETTSARQRIIVALDVATEVEALRLVETLREYVGMFKIGLELFTSVGPSIVQRVRAEGGEVFLDCKYMDIPATVAGAARAATMMGVRMLNVHCFGGREMLSATITAVREASARSGEIRPLVLGVTVLTSIDQAILERDIGLRIPLTEQVVHLATMAMSTGLDGVISSPMEIKSLRSSMPPGRLIVTPGVRPSWADPNDQRRFATPAEAIARGADFVVLGRPITRPPTSVGSPKLAAIRVADEILAAA